MNKSTQIIILMVLHSKRNIHELGIEKDQLEIGLTRLWDKGYIRELGQITEEGMNKVAQLLSIM